MATRFAEWNILDNSIIQSTDDPNLLQISLKALLFNFSLLYGIAIAAELIPLYTGTSKRGFFCNDETIMYPYKSDTISTSFLFTYCILLTFIVIVLVELYRMKKETSSSEQPRYQLKNQSINSFFVRVFTYFAYTQIGFVAVLIVTNTTKGVAGRLRPHFLDVCKPVGTNCSSNLMSFETSYTCLGDPGKVEEARKSFFSGHSSFSMYATVWSVIFIQARFGTVYGNKVIVPMIQILLVAMGLSICYSRVSDYKHHWSDVIVGIFAGSFIATYSCICWAGLFKEMVTPPFCTTSPFMVVEEGRRDSITSPIENIHLLESEIEEESSKAGISQQQ